MKISTWDEICGEWSTHELAIPVTRDPETINRALGQTIAEQEEGDGFEIKNHSFTGPILTIESRSDRNHLNIIVVNYEDQED